jgi:hypothetical protein
MKTNLHNWLAGGLALVLIAPTSMAQGESKTSSWRDGLYVEFAGGTSTVPGGDITLDGLEWEGEYENGTLFVASFGKNWTDNWATEIEYFYRTNDIDTLTSGNRVLAGGDLASTNVFVNVVYTFDGILGSKWRPYGGLGAGWMTETDIDLADLPGEEFSTQGVFGYQWMVGLQRTFGGSLTGFLEGRAIAGGSQDLDSSRDGRILEVEYNTWSLIVGLQWSF